MRVARLTIELLRPVPLGRVEVAVRTLRPGRKVQLIEASLSAGGTEVARATGLRIRVADRPLPEGAHETGTLADPSDALAWTFERVGPLNFGAAMEFAPLVGGPGQVGRATVWFRLRVPVVAGEETSPLMRVAAAADFGNGVSAVVDWNGGWMFINPDLTIHLSRYPRGEWVALEAVTHASDDGIGFAESAPLRRGRPHRPLGPEPPVRHALARLAARALTRLSRIFSIRIMQTLRWRRVGRALRRAPRVRRPGRGAADGPAGRVPRRARGVPGQAPPGDEPGRAARVRAGPEGRVPAGPARDRDHRARGGGGDRRRRARVPVRRDPPPGPDRPPGA